MGAPLFLVSGPNNPEGQSVCALLPGRLNCAGTLGGYSRLGKPPQLTDSFHLKGFAGGEGYTPYIYTQLQKPVAQGGFTDP